MDDADLALRNATYARFVALGRAPAPEELGDREVVLDGWRRLHDAHALVLDPTGQALLMANPFAAAPTPFRVHAAGRDWYANCAWDAFGVCAALHVDGTIETDCPDCGDEIVVRVLGGRADDATLRFHCLVPAAHWWDDIAFT